MNPPDDRTDDCSAPQAQDKTHDSRACGETATQKRLLVRIEGDGPATKALMERLLTRSFPQWDDDEGLSSIEVPSPYAYFLFVDVKILGDRQTWQTSQRELDAEAASGNRIIVVPCATAPDSVLDFGPFHRVGVAIKTVSALGQHHECASVPSTAGPNDQAGGADEAQLNDLLAAMTEFAEQEGLLAHVGGY